MKPIRSICVNGLLATTLHAALAESKTGPDSPRPASCRWVFEVRIDVDRVEDAEGLLADFVAKPCRAPEHLLIEDTAAGG